ncbi:MAG: preprotein translocase subunit YajC [Methylothermaceae bacteria B42]|nr:MAG: preprotein translocase subunit YajC [Methylothermaceae bacteria B42]HHJ39982.1 preprotein translocase subunit YajC [Methylothermaceae bacterium]
MGFFISDALAQAAPPAQEPGIVGLLLPLAIFAFFYLLFIWPQQKRAKEHKKMVQSLGKGTDVVTNGGIVGRVVDLDESFVVLEVADGIHIQVQRNAIATILPKGSFKAIKKKIAKAEKSS